MSTAVHLLVLIAGMWGNTGHLAELSRIVQETYETPSKDGVELEVLLAETNSKNSTYDGMDWGGERVAQEVKERIEELEKGGKQVTQFSITGYSLGGLVGRYLVGILHQQGFFTNVTPVNFNTIAAPHIGLPHYRSLISYVRSSVASKLLSRTGEQFYCIDKWSPNGRPLLEVMADPNRIFYQALALFKHIRIYANTVNDMTVPYVTAAIEVEDPFVGHETSGIHVEFEEGYEMIVKSYTIPEHPPPPPPKPVIPGWVRNLKKPPSALPPPLQLRFPFNIALYASIPFVTPIVVPLALLHFSLAARSSRARIRHLENEEPGAGQRLANILADLEKEVEDATINLVDSSNGEASSSKEEILAKSKPEHPILSPAQRKMAAWLNALPVTKVLVYFPDMQNAHAMIVCRDLKQVESQRRGEGVIRHWARAFVL
ncbi:putative serine esterase-domain-containing protein [Cyathus striatus]|nr:putative serine esterase-domain-containing protein [Cyathus striatus]